jgi:hypothetical protein
MLRLEIRKPRQKLDAAIARREADEPQARTGWASRNVLAQAEHGSTRLPGPGPPPLRAIRPHDVPALSGLGVATGLQTIAFLAAIGRIRLAPPSRLSSSAR